MFLVKHKCLKAFYLLAQSSSSHIFLIILYIILLSVIMVIMAYISSSSSSATVQGSVLLPHYRTLSHTSLVQHVTIHIHIIIIIIRAGMAVVEEKRRWPIINASPQGQCSKLILNLEGKACSDEETIPVTWSDEKLILLYCPGRGSKSQNECFQQVQTSLDCVRIEQFTIMKTV